MMFLSFGLTGLSDYTVDWTSACQAFQPATMSRHSFSKVEVDVNSREVVDSMRTNTAGCGVKMWSTTSKCLVGFSSHNWRGYFHIVSVAQSGKDLSSGIQDQLWASFNDLSERLAFLEGFNHKRYFWLDGPLQIGLPFTISMDVLSVELVYTLESVSITPDVEHLITGVLTAVKFSGFRQSS